MYFNTSAKKNLKIWNPILATLKKEDRDDTIDVMLVNVWGAGKTYESRLLLWLPPKGMLTLLTVAKATLFLAVLLMARNVSQT